MHFDDGSEKNSAAIEINNRTIKHCFNEYGIRITDEYSIFMSFFFLSQQKTLLTLKYPQRLATLSDAISSDQIESHLKWIHKRSFNQNLWYK